MKNKELSVPGGFDNEGVLTKDPGVILQSKRPLSIGYWKGAGLSLLLDVLATILSGGFSVAEISKQKGEVSLSQVFICIDLTKLSNYSSIPLMLKNIIDDYKQSVPDGSAKIVYPGEGVVQKRNKNMQEGITVLKEKWEEILQL